MWVIRGQRASHELQTFIVLHISLILLKRAQSERLLSGSFPEQLSRGPPQSGSQSNLWISDETHYVGLGDHIGITIAVGDFTCDRYSDLLVIRDSHRMRSVQVLAWNHHEFSFRAASSGGCPPHQSTFSLDSILSLSSEARISSAVTLDTNSDGYLDVLLSIQVSRRAYGGIVLKGDGSGCLLFDQILPDVTPGMLILDANEDMSPDIFFITAVGEMVFYMNDKRGLFMKKVWKPKHDYDQCAPTHPFNSNAFVDVNGDCLPDLVVSTSCGLEVWYGDGLQNKSSSRWILGQEFRKKRGDISDLSLPDDQHRFQLLDSSIWDSNAGDGMATFADFNGDGSIDIGVPNAETGELRISYNVLSEKQRSNLCTRSRTGSTKYVTEVALKNIQVPDTALGNIRMESRIRVGDFNFDSKLDVMFISGETGTLTLFEAQSVERHASWFLGSWGLSMLKDMILFAVTGFRKHRHPISSVETLQYVQSCGEVLSNIEDPIGAAFFDMDESGRQDILVAQNHGTRLLWNNLKGFEDSVFFKATAVDSTHHVWRSPSTGLHAFSPIPGNTFKLSYGGRHKRETHICSQCPQTGFLSLQSCSCIFGITRIANYIEEMAMGGAHGVRTWKNLMPNALAVVWPRRQSTRGVLKWKISYLSKGRDGQMRRIVFVLLATLVMLFFAILYAHSLEKREEGHNKLDFGYT